MLAFCCLGDCSVGVIVRMDDPQLTCDWVTVSGEEAASVISDGLCVGFPFSNETLIRVRVSH